MYYLHKEIFPMIWIIAEYQRKVTEEIETFEKTETKYKLGSQESDPTPPSKTVSAQLLFGLACVFSGKFLQFSGIWGCMSLNHKSSTFPNNCLMKQSVSLGGRVKGILPDNFKWSTEYLKHIKSFKRRFFLSSSLFAWVSNPVCKDTITPWRTGGWQNQKGKEY